jgi:ParB family chromosome partitioning protein
LNITEVPCEVKIYDSEQQIIKDLLETNLRQRGIGNTNAIKLGRCIVELEKIYGIKNGNNQHSLGDNLVPKTQDDLASELGVSQQQLSDYKKLLTLIPELQQLIETNQLSPTIGYKVLSKLSQKKAEELINGA